MRPDPVTTAAEQQHVVRVTLHVPAPCCKRMVMLRVDGTVEPDGSTVIDGAAAHALRLHGRFCSG